MSPVGDPERSAINLLLNLSRCRTAHLRHVCVQKDRERRDDFDHARNCIFTRPAVMRDQFGNLARVPDI